MRLSALTGFFSGYLHEDWASEFSETNEAVEHFVVFGTEESVTQALGELTVLLESNADDDRLHRLMRSAGCAYRPIGESRREWLQSVSDRMVAAALERWPLLDD